MFEKHKMNFTTTTTTKFLIFLIFFGITTGLDNKAKYDNYRLCRVHLVTEEHVRIFQELEKQSDSCTFMGHANNPNQNLTIMVAGHKIADFNSLVDRYGIKNEVLVYKKFNKM